MPLLFPWSMTITSSVEPINIVWEMGQGLDTAAAGTERDVHDAVRSQPATRGLRASQERRA